MPSTNTTTAATSNVSRHPISVTMIATTGAIRWPAPLPVLSSPIARPRLRWNQNINAAENG